MNTQISLEFEAPQMLHGTYPLRYHLLRIGDGELAGKFWHQNSIWEGYNGDGYPETELEIRVAKYTIARSASDMRKLIEAAANDTNPNKTHYIMAKMDAGIYKAMPGYLD